MRHIVPAFLVLALIGCATAPASAPPPQATAQSGPRLVPVHFESVPSGAELYLDGKLVGSTSVGFRVAPGEHLVEMRRDGFQPWRRELTVMPDNPTKLVANLIRQ